MRRRTAPWARRLLPKRSRTRRGRLTKTWAAHETWAARRINLWGKDPDSLEADARGGTERQHFEAHPSNISHPVPTWQCACNDYQAMCQELCASGHLTTGGVRGVYPWFIPAVLSGYGGYGGGGGQGRGGGRWGNHGRGQGSQPHAPPASEEAKAAFEEQLNASVAAYVEAAVTRDSEDEDAAPADGFVPKIFVKDARQRLGYRIGFCERPEDDCNEPTIEPRMRTWLMNNGRNAPAHIRPLPLFALLLEGLQLLGGDRRALSLLMVMLMNSFKRAGKRELERRQKREQDLKRDKFNMGWRSDDDDDFDPGSDGLGPRSRGGRGEGRREPQRERSRERDRGHRDRRPYGSTHTLAVWAVGVAALIADGTHPRRFKWR